MRISFGQETLYRHQRHPHLDMGDVTSKPKIPNYISPLRYSKYERVHRISNPVVVEFPGRKVTLTVKRVDYDNRPNNLTLAEGDFIEAVIVKQTTPGQQSSVWFPLSKTAYPHMRYSEDHSVENDSVLTAWKAILKALPDAPHQPKDPKIIALEPYKKYINELAQQLEALR